MVFQNDCCENSFAFNPPVPAFITGRSRVPQSTIEVNNQGYASDVATLLNTGNNLKTLLNYNAVETLSNAPILTAAANALLSNSFNIAGTAFAGVLFHSRLYDPANSANTNYSMYDNLGNPVVDAPLANLLGTNNFPYPGANQVIADFIPNFYDNGETPTPYGWFRLLHQITSDVSLFVFAQVLPNVNWIPECPEEGGPDSCSASNQSYDQYFGQDCYNNCPYA